MLECNECYVVRQEAKASIDADDFLVVKSAHPSQTLRAEMNTKTLYRPVGPQELALIEASGFKEFPPRLPEQPIFYPVLNEEYATQIARNWNATRDGTGYVTRFEVTAEFLKRYLVQTVGSSIHQELWVPAVDLADFNRHIVGLIEVIASF